MKTSRWIMVCATAFFAGYWVDEGLDRRVQDLEVRRRLTAGLTRVIDEGLLIINTQRLAEVRDQQEHDRAGD